MSKKNNHKCNAVRVESIEDILDLFNINISDFDVRSEYFDTHPEKDNIHGLYHTYRVMINTIVISYLRNSPRDCILSLCSAFIHDMARRPHQWNWEHGGLSAKTKVVQFKDLFDKYHITPKELNIIQSAVTKHSVNDNKYTTNEEDYYIVSTLKDADGLDRVRINDLDERFLRLRESRTIITFSRVIYELTGDDTGEEITFKSFLQKIKGSKFN
ncbi:DUF1810 domain-containing protein [Entamoeba marina]